MSEPDIIKWQAEQILRFFGEWPIRSCLPSELISVLALGVRAEITPSSSRGSTWPDERRAAAIFSAGESEKWRAEKSAFSSVKSGHQLLIISFIRSDRSIVTPYVYLRSALCFAPFNFGTHAIKYSSLLIHISSAPCSLRAYCFPASALCCKRAQNEFAFVQLRESCFIICAALFSLNFNKIPNLLRCEHKRLCSASVRLFSCTFASAKLTKITRTVYKALHCEAFAQKISNQRRAVYIYKAYKVTGN